MCFSWTEWDAHAPKSNNLHKVPKRYALHSFKKPIEYENVYIILWKIKTTNNGPVNKGFVSGKVFGKFDFFYN